MTARYTPGPWAVRARPNHLEVFPVNEAGIRPTLAKVDKWAREGVNEANANARLIAAAPELLEALVDLLYQARLSADEGGWDFDTAAAAIAKATGEAV